MHHLAKTLLSVVVALILTGGAVAQSIGDRPNGGRASDDLPNDGIQVAGIDGVFLMPGLQELEGQAVVFDKPGGRIIEAQAQGMVTARAVDAWYAESLKANGWKSSKLSGQYFKDGEMLQLAIQENGSGRSDGITLRFSLAPKD